MKVGDLVKSFLDGEIGIISYVYSESKWDVVFPCGEYTVDATEFGLVSYER